MIDKANQAVTANPIDLLNSSYLVIQQAVITNLEQPMAFEFAPQDLSLVFIAEKSGVMWVFDLDTGNFLPDFVDLTPEVNGSFDRGLIDIAFHPNFPAKSAAVHARR